MATIELIKRNDVNLDFTMTNVPIGATVVKGYFMIKKNLDDDDSLALVSGETTVIDNTIATQAKFTIPIGNLALDALNPSIKDDSYYWAAKAILDTGAALASKELRGFCKILPAGVERVTT